jgi:voltage-gated potassium channel Kch
LKKIMKEPSMPTKPSQRPCNRKPRENKFLKRTALFWQEQETLVLILMAAVAAVLGAIGYWQVLGYSLSHYSPWKLVYMTVQLFVLEANLDAAETVPWELSVARLLGPMSVGFAAWKTAAALFRERFKLLRLPYHKQHIVICGLGERGLQLVREYCRKPEKVVVVEADGENDFISTCRALGALVIVGDATEEVVMRRAGIGRARCVFAISGDDGSNFEIGALVSRLIALMPRSKPQHITCYVAVNNILLTDINPSSRILEHNLKDCTTRIIRINDLAARLLFRDHPLDRARITPNDPTVVHLIIAGFGAMGESVALQAARIGHFANGKKLRITAIDRDAVRKGKLLLQTMPGLSECCDIEFIDRDIDTAEFGEFVRDRISQPGSLPFLTFCLNDNTTSVSYALRLRRIVADTTMPIHVRLSDDSGLGVLLDDAGPRQVNIHGFGMVDHTCTQGMIENEELDKLARTIHEGYCRERMAEGVSPNDSALLPWDKLESTLRESNRQQADHIPFKLRACGYKMVEAGACPEKSRIMEFSPEQRQILGRMEHARWNAERLLSGWRYGPKKDVANSITPYLVAWEKLPENIQAYDIQAIQKIPTTLELQKKWICRRI